MESVSFRSVLFTLSSVGLFGLVNFASFAATRHIDFFIMLNYKIDEVVLSEEWSLDLARTEK